MNVTLDLHPELHNEFNFAEGTESAGCCCFWSSKPSKQYSVDEQNRLVPKRQLSFKKRIEAEKKLANIIRMRFEDDPIENDQAFKCLKFKINDNLESGAPITDERLMIIVNNIYELKKEIRSFR